MNMGNTKDPHLREQLVIKYLGLVKYLAGRLAVHAPSAMTQDDLEGYGVIGLLDAIEKFNDKLGTEFKNYAYTRIRGSILDEIRKQNWVPRSKWQKFDQLSKVKERFLHQGDEPDEQAIAAELGVDITQVRQLVSEYRLSFTVSLDGLGGAENGYAAAELISDPASPDPLDVITETDEKETLIGAIRDLPERDQTVLALYYQEELTLKEIGSVLDITESRVCQLHARALQKLREKLGVVMARTSQKKGARV